MWERACPHLRSGRRLNLFTPGLAQAGVQGTVLLEAVVSPEGNVEVKRVVRPVGWGLEENAAEALAKWKFDPALKDGERVSVVLDIEIKFALNSD